MLDGNARQNLATFCQTWFDDEIHKLMDVSIDKNMIDKDEYPATAEIEDRCVHAIADLWNSPSSAETIGCSTTGSSEAAMLGGLALKWKWRQRREQLGKPSDRPNIVTGPVQVCWHKFARYFDVEIREVPLERDRLGLTPEQVVAHVDENTIGVVCTLGVTFTCQYEPVADIAAALDALQAKSGLDIPIHVDAASGGLVAPFVSPELALGLSNRTRPIDQYVGTQVRACTAGRRLGCLAREERPAGRTDLSRQLFGRRNADIRAQLLTAGWPSRRSVLSHAALG